MINPTLKQRAEQAMPGGVNSPVRAFRSVGGDPIFAREAKGPRLTTVDGRSLIDFCMSFGPLILGHAHENVIRAITDAASRGTSFAVTTEAEVELAELIQCAIPSMQRLRLVSSGTEACMTAIRLARGYTGRTRILKFSGCYHGHADSVLVQAGSGVAGIAEASSAGVPASLAEHTLVARYNHEDDVQTLVRQYGSDLAAIFVEPVAANMGLLQPAEGFLAFLRKQADSCGALLVFDEVITGFRFVFGGYQKVSGVTPDLTCLGKIIGGGMPVGALGGRADIMEKLAPLGPVYQAGTLSGNPVSVAAGLATLRTLRELNPYDDLARRTDTWVEQLKREVEDAGLPIQLPHIGSIFAPLFTATPISDFDDILTADQTLFQRMFHALLKRGVYLPPSPFEVGFLSVAHTGDNLEPALEAWRDALKESR